MSFTRLLFAFSFVFGFAQVASAQYAMPPAPTATTTTTVTILTPSAPQLAPNVDDVLEIRITKPSTTRPATFADVVLGVSDAPENIEGAEIYTIPLNGATMKIVAQGDAAQALAAAIVAQGTELSKNPSLDLRKISPVVLKGRGTNVKHVANSCVHLFGSWTTNPPAPAPVLGPTVITNVVYLKPYYCSRRRIWVYPQY